MTDKNETLELVEAVRKRKWTKKQLLKTTTEEQRNEFKELVLLIGVGNAELLVQEVRDKLLQLLK